MRGQHVRNMVQQYTEAGWRATEIAQLLGITADHVSRVRFAIKNGVTYRKRERKPRSPPKNPCPYCGMSIRSRKWSCFRIECQKKLEIDAIKGAGI